MTCLHNSKPEDQAFGALLAAMLCLDSAAGKEAMLWTENGCAAEDDQTLLRETSERVTRAVIEGQLSPAIGKREFSAGPAAIGPARDSTAA